MKNTPVSHTLAAIREKNSEKFHLGNGRETLKEKKEQRVYAIAYKFGRK